MKSVIENLRGRFPRNSQFSLKPEESINTAVRNGEVPDSPGVYLIFRSDDLTRPVYVGKAGTVQSHGSMKRQGLRKRLTAKQGRKSRARYFREKMKKEGCGLTFLWFVTFDQDSRILPALIEMEVLQAYFDQHGRLPEMNKSA